MFYSEMNIFDFWRKTFLVEKKNSKKLFFFILGFFSNLVSSKTDRFFRRKWISRFFSQKIKSTWPEVKHIQSRASNSSWAARTSQPKSKNPRRSFFDKFLSKLSDHMLRSSELPVRDRIPFYREGSVYPHLRHHAPLVRIQWLALDLPVVFIHNIIQPVYTPRKCNLKKRKRMSTLPQILPQMPRCKSSDSSGTAPAD